MRIAAIFTDLDGTLLEPDGRAVPEAAEALRWLAGRGVPVFAVTSKTAAEIALLVRDLDLCGAAGFENGAGVTLPDGGVELHPAAVPLPQLVEVASRLRYATGAPLRTLLELDDGELSALTGLAPLELAAARQRRATLPLVVDGEWDETLRTALPPEPALRVLRGNRFLHLQGDHDKADLVTRLSEMVGNGEGLVAALGDSPNDIGLLAAADVPCIVPGPAGAHPELLRRFPAARVGSQPHGRGWAALVFELLGGR